MPKQPAKPRTAQAPPRTRSPCPSRALCRDHAFSSCAKANSLTNRESDQRGCFRARRLREAGWRAASRSRQETRTDSPPLSGPELDPSPSIGFDFACYAHASFDGRTTKEDATMNDPVRCVDRNLGDGRIGAEGSCKSQAGDNEARWCGPDSFMKKCQTDATSACESQLRKKTRRRSKTSFTKKCVSDASALTGSRELRRRSTARGPAYREIGDRLIEGPIPLTADRSGVSFAHNFRCHVFHAQVFRRAKFRSHVSESPVFQATV